MSAQLDQTRTSDVIAGGRQKKRPGQLDTVVEEGDTHDYSISASAIRRAFPDLSDIESLPDEEEEFSIEVGRGAQPLRRGARGGVAATGGVVEDSRDSVMSVDELSPIVASPAGRIRLDGLQQGAIASQTNRAGNRDNLRKDASIRRANAAVRDREGLDIVDSKLRRPRHSSGSGGIGNSQQRRVMSNIENVNPSLVSDDAFANAAALKNSRFVSNRNRVQDQSARIAEAVNNAAGKSYPRDNNNNRRPNRGLNTGKQTPSIQQQQQQQQQSFLLPDVDGISELVSGILNENPADQVQPRTTRFITRSGGTGGGGGGGGTTTNPQDCIPLDAVPIPDDEKVIFTSLKLLQEKVEALQADKTDIEGRLVELEQENYSLKKAQAQTSRANSRIVQRTAAAAAYASDDNEQYRKPANNNNTRSASERNRPEPQQSTTNNISRDWRLQNEELTKENSELRARLAKLMASEAPVEKSTKSGKSPYPKRKASDVQRVKDDDYAGLFSLDIPVRQPQHHTQPQAQTQTQSQSHTQSQPQQQQQAQPQQPTKGEKSSKVKASDETKQSSLKRARAVSRNMVPADLDDGVVSDTEVTERRRQQDGPRDMTYLNFIDATEIARLRKAMEEEKFAEKNHLVQKKLVAAADDGAVREPTASGGILKSALRRNQTTTNFNVDADGGGDETSTKPIGQGDPTATNVSAAGGGEGNLTQASMTSNRLRRRKSLGGGDDHNNTAPGDISLKVTKPVPVTDRMQEFEQQQQHNGDEAGAANTDSGAGAGTGHEQEHTQRPAQSPAMALATVISTMEYELKELKAQLVSSENDLQKHDAAMGKRQRKALGAKMERLLVDIDAKSDQIYALYDVLEGQKIAGVEMTEGEVDMTIHSIVDGKKKKRVSNAAAGTNNGDDDQEADDESSWDGFDDDAADQRRRRSRVSKT